MSEAMITERIAEAEWVLKGYWTKLRFPFQTTSGGWSDVDVLAYHPEKKHLVISESKVRGPKSHVYAYTGYTAENYGSILDYDDDNYLSFIGNVGLLCQDGVIFENFAKMVKRLTVQLISNYAIAADVIEQAKSDVKGAVMDHLKLEIPLEVRLDTTIDVLAEVILLERGSAQGRRYGHPVIDVARELNRYVNPDVRYAGRERAATEAVRAAALEKLLKALNPEADA